MTFIEYFQYRMHPEISRFPSIFFYDGKLLNGDQMNQKSAPFHNTKSLGPYVFYDITDGLELRVNNSGSMSLYNEHEADAAVEVLRFFKRRYDLHFCVLWVNFNVLRADSYHCMFNDCVLLINFCYNCIFAKGTHRNSLAEGLAL